MKKVKIVEQKIRLSSAIALNIEVNGLYREDKEGRPIFRFVGLTEQRLSAATKYWLNKLGKSLEKEQKHYDELRKELIKKYGEELEDPKTKEKYFSIEPKIKDPDFKPKSKKGEVEEEAPLIDNPNVKLFKKEEQDLLKQIIAVKIPKFDIDELFCFQTEQNYSNAYHFLVQEDDENFEYNDLEYAEEVEEEPSTSDKKD